MILVEGIFDVLNLHDKGLPNAVCCFGTRNVSVEKLSLLKMTGVDGIDILFDPDEAGQMAVEDVQNMCLAAELTFKNIKLPVSLGDAGALPLNQVIKLKEQLYG